jgi:penicillin amidase
VFTPLPEETTVDDRLTMLPTADLELERPVTIRWTEQQVPFIEAETDRDLAYVLGMVHAHLRLGQMEVIRRISQGRLSEMVGPFTTDIDVAIRTLDLGKAVPEIEAEMPTETRIWTAAFVDGINSYVRQAEATSTLPHEFAVLDLDVERWSVADVLTMGRLYSVDINWGRYFRMLPQRARSDWPELWAAYLQDGAQALPSYDPNAPSGLRRFTQLLTATGKSGSNAFAVHASRSATGGALIASDPHLGIVIPNVWLLAGFKSPGYHVVGMMPPGVPLIGVGRNRHIAWGGTNLHSANSDLVDVSHLSGDEVKTRTETIRSRWWFDQDSPIRDTPYGPIITDLDVLKDEAEVPISETIALRWIGHRATDELTAMLAVARARNWREFRDALSGFAIAPQAFVYADDAGQIGIATATMLPNRPQDAPTDVVQPSDGPNDWDHLVTSDTLPAVLNPSAGFVASANNPPAPADVPISYFFAPSDRVDRLNGALMALADGGATVRDLMQLQTDTLWPRSVDLIQLLLDKARAAQKDGWAPTESADGILATVAAWDGRYSAGSRGALLAEALMIAFLDRFLENAGDPRHTTLSRRRVSARALVAAAAPAEVVRALEPALSSVAEAIADDTKWGDVHRLRLAHPLGLIPILGERYVLLDLPASGASQTIMKTAADPSVERHDVFFGSNARHVSDMSDVDANWFVLLGGQDGWLKSETGIDQVPLWERNEYLQLPLSDAKVNEIFDHATTVLTN